MTTNTSAAPADDFIPAPADSGTEVSKAVSAVANATTEALTNPEPRIGQTEAILGIVAVLALAGLLLLVRNTVRKSLIAGRATIDSANAAAWSWYLVLLASGALVVAGLVGGLFASDIFIAATAATLIIGVLVALRMTARARHSA